GPGFAPGVGRPHASAPGRAGPRQYCPTGCWPLTAEEPPPHHEAAGQRRQAPAWTARARVVRACVPPPEPAPPADAGRLRCPPAGCPEAAAAARFAAPAVGPARGC